MSCWRTCGPDPQPPRFPRPNCRQVSAPTPQSRRAPTQPIYTLVLCRGGCHHQVPGLIDIHHHPSSDSLPESPRHILRNQTSPIHLFLARMDPVLNPLYDTASALSPQRCACTVYCCVWAPHPLIIIKLMVITYHHLGSALQGSTHASTATAAGQPTTPC